VSTRAYSCCHTIVSWLLFICLTIQSDKNESIFHPDHYRRHYRLIDFYEQITSTSLAKYTEDFAELRTLQANLAIGSTKTLALLGNPEIAIPAANR
jgi:hypothetical protein